MKKATITQGARWIRTFGFVISLSLSLTSGKSAAEVSSLPRADLWGPDGPVYAILETNGITYLGGHFSYVGPHSGMGSLFDLTSGVKDQSFPQADGPLLAAISDEAGGWFVGGRFSSVGNVAVKNLVHIRRDRTVDLEWRPEPDDSVFALQLRENTLFVGGRFSNIGGQARNRLAAVDITSGKALAWQADITSLDPTNPGVVYSMVLSGATLFLGGGFALVGGQERENLAAVDAISGNVTAWHPNGRTVPHEVGNVRTLQISGNTVYAGGLFTYIFPPGGTRQPRMFLAAFDASSGALLDWNPGADGQVFCSTMMCETLIVGGVFTSVGGQPRARVAGIDRNSGAVTNWKPEADDAVYSMAISGNSVHLGGKFNMIGGEKRDFAAAVDVITGRATTWNPQADYAVSALAIAGSRVFAGGKAGGGGVKRNNLVALEVRTGKATAWNPNPHGYVGALAASGNSVVVGGWFTNIAGQARHQVAALDDISGASLWPAQTNLPNRSLFDFYVRALAISGNKVFVGGSFTNIAGQARNKIAALDLNTGLATDWNPGANDEVDALTVVGERLYVGGRFTQIAGQPRKKIAALDITTGQATAWNPGADDQIFALAHSGNTLYVGGLFAVLGGQRRNCLGAIDLNSESANSWNPNPANTNFFGRIQLSAGINGLAVSSNAVYAAGLFDEVGGKARRNAAAIIMSGTGTPLDWHPETNGELMAIAASRDTVYVGGYKLVGYQSEPLFMVFPPSGAPVITSQPSGQRVNAGERVTFNVEVTGEVPLSFQWQLNGTNLAGTSQRTFTLPSVQSIDAGNYRVVVTNRLGLISSAEATLIVIEPVRIVSQPASQVVVPSTNVTLRVSATGSPPPAFKWRRNGVNIPGAVFSSLTLTNVQPTDGGQYSVAVENLAGATNSELAELIVTSPPLPWADHLQNRVLTNSLSGLGSGNSTTATKEASEPEHAGKPGRRSLWLGWRAPANGVVTFSTRGSAFDTLLAIYTNSLPNGPLDYANLRLVAADDDRGGFLTSETVFGVVAGVEYLVAVDGFGKASGNLVLSWKLDTAVAEVPRIFQQPVSATVGMGESLTLSVTAFSTRPLTYVWVHNCDVLVGATNATLVVTNVQAARVGRYTVYVRGGAQAVESAPAFLEINFSGEAGQVQKVASRDKLADRTVLGALAGPASVEPVSRWLLSTRGRREEGELLSPGFGGAPARGFVGTQIFHTFGHARELGEPNHAGEPGGASAWYSVLAEEEGKMLVSTEGSDFDTVVAVYEGPANPLGYDELVLPPVAADNNSGFDRQTSRVIFSASRNRTYHIAVDGVNGAQGQVVLTYQLGSPPEVTVQPVSGVWKVGNVVILVVQARSRVPVAYQWQLNGVALKGATNATLVLPVFQSANAGAYSCVVSNFAGVVNSVEALLRVDSVEALKLLGQRLPDGSFSLLLSGASTSNAVLQASTNLIQWVPIYTNSRKAEKVEFVDRAATNYPWRFYRAQP